MYTIETVKSELPKVQIKVGKQILTANVSGRKNKFATVWTGENEWEFSWNAIVHSLNNGKPLRI